MNPEGKQQQKWTFVKFGLVSYFGLLAGVPGEGNGIIGNLFNVANGVEALLVVSCCHQKKKKISYLLVLFHRNDTQKHFFCIHFQLLYDTNSLNGFRNNDP